jgi:ankyrin repeat protein
VQQAIQEYDSAPQNGHEAVVKLLLQEDAEVKAAKNDGWIALYSAALIGHEAVVKLLLQEGAILQRKMDMKQLSSSCSKKVRKWE